MEEKNTRQMIQFYDNLATSYDELYCKEQDAKYQQIQSAIRHKKISRLIDTGCGTGKLILLLESRCNEIVGLDISNQMIRMARDREYVRRPSLVRASISHMPFQNEVADVVTSISVLEDDPNLQSHLSELNRITNPHGTMIFTIFGDISEELGSMAVQRAGKHEFLQVIGKS